MKNFTLLFISALSLIQLSGISTAQTILSADFESGLPTGWTITTNASDGGWKFGNSNALQSYFFQIPSHTNIACTNDDACQCDKSVDYLITPSMDFTSFDSVTLNFNSFFNAYSYGSAYEVATIEVSIDGGFNWNIANSLPATNPWTNYTVSLSAYHGQSDVQVAFHFNDEGFWLWGWAIDDVLIFGSSTGINSVIPGVAGVGIYPNPVNEVMNVKFALNATQNVLLELTDVSGHVLMQKDQGVLSKGNHELQINSKNLSAGVYVFIIKTDSGSVTTKVVKS